MAKGKTKEPHSVSEVVEGLEELAESESQVTFADVLDKFGTRSFAPVMMVLALLEATPVGMIPGVPSFLALCVLLIAVQMLLGRDHIWVPDWIAERSVSNDKMEKATEKLEGPAEAIDEISKERLEGLAEGPAIRIAAGLICVLALMVPPLEVLPWASMGPMIAIAVICLAIMVRDGLAMLAAWIVAGAAVAGGLYWYLTSDASSSLIPF